MGPEEAQSLQEGERVQLIEDPKISCGVDWNQRFFDEIWGCSAKFLHVEKRRFTIFNKATYDSLYVKILEGSKEGVYTTIPLICFQSRLTEKICPACEGTGLLDYKDECPHCKGQGIVCSNANS